jgi:hypothetical protein
MKAFSPFVPLLYSLHKKDFVINVTFSFFGAGFYLFLAFLHNFTPVNRLENGICCCFCGIFGLYMLNITKIIIEYLQK